MRHAAKRPQIAVVGSAPYVESSRHSQERNMREIIELAEECDCEVDFHLDYDLRPLEDDQPEPLIYYLLSELTAKRVGGSTGVNARRRHITIGHSTRLSQFTDKEWLSFLQERVKPAGVTLHFIGLPQSDVYMMAKTEEDMLHVGEGSGCGTRPRGTLDIPRLSMLMKRNEFESDFAGKADVCMAVNNVGNPFTPQVNPDPLALCQLGICVYQSSTAASCRALLVCESTSMNPFSLMAVTPDSRIL
jgi:hypothetical protein